MDKSPRPFQIGITALFVVLFILGFLGFSGKLDGILPKSNKEVSYGEVTLWGSIPKATMQTIITNYFRDEKRFTIKYVEKNDATLTADLVEALASGKGPDLVVLPQDELLRNLNKVTAIPYQSISERDFKNTFIQEGEMFLRPDGVVALPLEVDPLVMYWNRDLFTSALVATPPAYWSAFYDLVPKITVRSDSGSIVKSFIAFGGYRNVTNAKEILSVLLMQAGSPVVTTSTNGNLVAALITQGPLNIENPVITAMRFYTEFSKPEKDSYSWNSSLPASRAMFEAGDLALYFGYASEYQSIKQKNPHLNFDVAMIPQVGSNATKLTFGRIYGVSILAASKNQAGAMIAATSLSSNGSVSALDALTGLPPVRRDLIAVRPTDPAQAVFYDSALISRAWYDPSPSGTNSIFMDMIDSVNSGRNSMNEAISIAHSSLSKLLQDYQLQQQQ